MTKKITFIMLAFTMFVLFVTTQTTLSCPQVPSSYKGPVKFTTDESEIEYVRHGHYIELRCCGAGFDVINWFKWNTATSNWDTYRPGPGELAPSFSEDKQILAIKSATENDAGKYKCQLYRNTTDNKERKFVLNVDRCDHLARGPIPIAPEPHDQYITKLGESVIFPCLGYFGCADEGDFRAVDWFMQDKSTEKWTDISSSGNKRYVETHFTRENVIVGTNLTITDVQRNDIDITFMCVMSSPQVVHGETRLSVKIYLKGENQVEMMADTSIVVVAVVAGTVLVVSIVIGVVILFRKIGRSRGVQKSRKTTSAKETEVNEYTACV